MSTEKLRLEGLSLGQYAAVTAALAEGHALLAVLEVEGISQIVWAAAEAAWSPRIVSDPALAAAYRAELDEAEDHLTRRVEPVDYDVGAWLSFFRAFSMNPSPADFLARQGVRASDVSRLQRLWARRMSQDPALQRRVAELAMQTLPDHGALRVEAARLRPSPVSSAPGDAAPETPAIDPAADLDLVQYAAISAEVSASPQRLTEVLARFGLQGGPNWDEAWRARLAADEALAKDFRSLLAHYRSRFARPRAGEAPRAESPAAPPPQTMVSGRAALRATVRAADAPVGSALPFQRVAPPPQVEIKTAEDRATTIRSRDLPESSVRSTLGAPLGPTKPVLPFQKQSTVEPRDLAPKAAEPALLSLEQHASLCVELALAPEQTASILVRYQLTADLKARADAYWRERAQAEPSIEAAWVTAFETYQRWLRSRQSSP